MSDNDNCSDNCYSDNESQTMITRLIMGELYCSNHMTAYMEIQYRDLITRVKALPEVIAFIENNESFCESGNEMKHESGDFV